MPDQTSTIGAGQDYSTVAAWEADADVSGGFWKGEIVDGANFDEHVVIQSPTGTPTSANYIWLTVADAVRHAGVVGTGHARVRPSTGGHAFEVHEPFTRIEHLEIAPGTSNSDECVRVQSGADDVLLDYLIFDGGANQSDQDGVYTGAYDVARLRVSNSMFFGFGRAGIHLQQFGGTGRTVTCDVDHVTFDDCGAAAETESGSINIRSEADDTITVTVHNVVSTRTQNSAEAFSVVGGGGPAAVLTWDGSHYVTDQAAPVDTTIGSGSVTDSTTDHTQATDGAVETDQATGSYVCYQAFGSDLTLRDVGGNIARTGGTNRQGSEPDARQDFSVDIAGATRPTTDPSYGAFEVNPIAGETIAVAQASEVDTGQPVSSGQQVAVAEASEADSAQPLGTAKTQPVGQAAQTDTAQPVGTGKTAVAGQSSDVESAQPVAAGKTQPIVQPPESDVAQPVATGGAIAIGQASEADTAQPIGAAKTTAVGQASETETAQPVGAAKSFTVAQASEADTAQPIATAKTHALGQPAETDVAQPVTQPGQQTVPVAQAVETDTALPVVRVRGYPLGQPVETDTAQPLATAKTVTVGQAVDDESAQPVAAPPIRLISQTVDNESAQPVTFVGAATLQRIRLTSREPAAAVTSREPTAAVTSRSSQ